MIMITNKPVVVLDGIRVERGTTQIFHDLSLEIHEGEFVALLGSNGSGKSTLLDLISGGLAPTTGTRSVHESRFAFVPQRTAINEHVPMTVRDTVAMGRWRRTGLTGRLNRTDRARIDEGLERMGIADLAHAQLRRLSGGQRQRALLAQALVQDAPLLLLDEPEAALDGHARTIIVDAVREEAERGTTVIMATHEAASARHAQRCVLLGERASGIIADGHPEHVLSHETLAQAFHAHD